MRTDSRDASGVGALGEDVERTPQPGGLVDAAGTPGDVLVGPHQETIGVDTAEAHTLAARTHEAEVHRASA